jgi:hypothetical protein
MHFTAIRLETAMLLTRFMFLKKYVLSKFWAVA